MYNEDEIPIKLILNSLTKRLERELSKKERRVFSQKRSFIAYELILDYINDTDKSKEDIESYVQRVISE